MMTQEYNERIVYIKEKMNDKAETFEEKENKKKEFIDQTAKLQRAPYVAKQTNKNIIKAMHYIFWQE
jgi:hypothetical protein